MMKRAAVLLLAVAFLSGAQDPSPDELKAKFDASTDVAERRAILGTLAKGHPKTAYEIAEKLLRDPVNQKPLVADAVAIAQKGATPRLVRAVIRVARRQTDADVLLPAIRALGAMIAITAVDEIEQHLGHSDRRVVTAAIDSLSKIASNPALDALLPLMEKPDVALQREVLAGMGRIRRMRAIPRMLEAYLVPETRQAAILAMANIPDMRAVEAYFEGLIHEDPAVRAKCRYAVLALNIQVLPEIERRLETASLPPKLIAVLKKLYTEPQPVRRWHVLSPMAHPTEEPFDVTLNGGAFNEGIFTAAYPGLNDQAVYFRNVDSAENGFVDLMALKKVDSEATGYGYAVVMTPETRETELLVGADDTVVLIQNSRIVYERKEGRAWEMGSDRVPVTLQAGANYFILKCARKDGGWGFSMHVPPVAGPNLAKAVVPEPVPRERYVEAAGSIAGSAEKGKQVFNGVAACIKCHAVAGEGGTLGPDLRDVGKRLTRDQLVESVLDPSRTITKGYEQEILLLRTGKLITGMTRKRNEEDFHFQHRSGRSQKYMNVEVTKRLKSTKSLMPDGLNTGMTPEDFADLIAYLRSLKPE